MSNGFPHPRAPPPPPLHPFSPYFPIIICFHKGSLSIANLQFHLPRIENLNIWNPYLSELLIVIQAIFIKLRWYGLNALASILQIGKNSAPTGKLLPFQHLSHNQSFSTLQMQSTLAICPTTSLKIAYVCYIFLTSPP